jgi:hypothetical protein
MDAPGSGSIVHTRYTPYKTFWWGIDTDGDSEPDRFVHVALIGDRLHYLDIISPNGR